ncbi:hypothetical protein FBU31_002579, partial [Coemansia sp. 'formosensis']
SATTPGECLLFVFPCSATLTSNAISQFCLAEFNKRNKKLLSKTAERSRIWISDLILRHGTEQYTGTKAIVFSHDHSTFVSVNVRPMTKDASDCIGRRKNDIDSKMDALIEYYENITMTTSALEVRKKLRARNIFCYDAQKTVGARTSGKRSFEEMVTVEEKQHVKRKKFLAQRSRNTNDKHREQSIGMSGLKLNDN